MGIGEVGRAVCGVSHAMAWAMCWWQRIEHVGWVGKSAFGSFAGTVLR